MVIRPHSATVGFAKWGVRSVFAGHTGTVRGALELSTGRILSRSVDEDLRFWDTRSGMCTSMLRGQSGALSGVTIASNGRILTWSWAIHYVYGNSLLVRDERGLWEQWAALRVRPL